VWSSRRTREEFRSFLGTLGKKTAAFALGGATSDVNRGRAQGIGGHPVGGVASGQGSVSRRSASAGRALGPTNTTDASSTLGGWITAGARVVPLVAQQARFLTGTPTSAARWGHAGPLQ
jgi:hypothetical protein